MKAELVFLQTIVEAMAEQSLVSSDIAVRMGMTQAQVARMLCGDFRGISLSKMMQCVDGLGYDIRITTKPAAAMAEWQIDCLTAFAADAQKPSGWRG